MQKLSFLIFLGLLGLSSGCTKEKMTRYHTTVQLSNNSIINDLTFVTADTGYAATGGIYEDGVLWQTTNGGLDWDTLAHSSWGVRSLKYRKNILVGHDAIIHFYKKSSVAPLKTKQSLEWDIVWTDLDFHTPNNFIIGGGGNNFSIGHIWLLDQNGYATIKHDFDHEIYAVEWVNASTIYAVGYGLILRSTDGGKSFDPYPSLKGDFFKSISFPSEKTGYIIGEYGTIFKTTDFGDTWKKLATGNTVFNKDNRLRKIHFTSENTGYIVGNAGLFWITTDGGDNWQRVTDLPNSDLISIDVINNKAYLGNRDGQIVIVDL
ncbi:MAG: hypothetical protein GY810_12875 [Aureispira sp.]|nr:hypothetical protein [Aureispira sp.]